MSSRARRHAIVGLVTVALLCLTTTPAFAPPKAGGSSTAASFVDYAQCANGAPETPPPPDAAACPDGWINGILQSTNSHYHEDEVTPQRLEVEVPAGAPRDGRTLTISYMTRKGSAQAHAYDSLATWNYTQTDADRCQGLTTTGKNPTCVLPSAPVSDDLPVCTNVTTACKFPMDSDPTEVPPANPDTAFNRTTSTHELPQANRQWVMYGGSITDASTPSHDAAGDATADDYATVTVTYRVPGAGATVTAPTKVQLLFGGHLAASAGDRGWGANLGAGNISGGPYHIKLVSADGASLGSKDNQIQSSAIIAGSPEFTIDKTVATDPVTNPPTAAPGEVVTYTVVVTNIGSAPGSTTFVDTYDEGVDIVNAGGCTDSPDDNQLTCTTGEISHIAPDNTATFTYTAEMPDDFTGTPGTGCGTGQYPVVNLVTLQGGGTDTATVCVTASPDFSVLKSANPSGTVNGGDTVEYTISVTNDGSAPGSTTFTDDYDDLITEVSAVTVDPADENAGCEAATVDGSAGFACDTSVLDPGDTQTFTYTAKMPTTFTGEPGGRDCTSDPAQYPVRNVVVLANGDTDDETLCVNAEPDFTVVKTASPTEDVQPGDQITYTITVTNGGSAPGSTTFTDDYDDRITDISGVTSEPVGGTCSNEEPLSEDNAGFTCETTVIEAGDDQTFTYTAKMPTTFTGAPGGDDCTSDPARYPVRNVVVLLNGNDDDAIVCVRADPDFDVTKTVATDPPSADPPTTTPGSDVTYTLEVTNTGTASGIGVATDTYEDGVVISGLPTGCTDDPENHTVTCTTGTLEAGEAESFSYTATMPTTFSGSSGGGVCDPGEYDVVNTVVVTNGESDSVTVCVPAEPDLTLDKSADVESTSFGGTVVYTLEYANTGPAEASGVLIVEDIPEGTTYASCTGGCDTDGPPVTQATWDIGTLAAGGSGSVTLTVTVTATTTCTICNTATISSPDFNNGEELESDTVCIPSTPGTPSGLAHANGNSLGANVTVSGLLNATTTDLSTAESSQTGVGTAPLDSDNILSAAIPSNASILSADVLRTTNASSVTANPSEARNTSTAEVLGLCVLPVAGVCTVQSSTVRAVASTVATGSSASHSDAGSTIENLMVAGLAVPVDLNAPNTVSLNPLVFGAGSYVAVNQRDSDIDTPTGQSGGTYAADLEVTMIHVHVTGLLLGLNLLAVDVTVAKAVSHSDHPQMTVCGDVATQTVSGHAFVASLFTTLPLDNVVQGYSDIPSSGGADEAHIADLKVPANGSVASAKAAHSSSAGTLTATQSRSDSLAEVAGDGTTPACLLKGTASCLITAQLVHSESHSVATASGASSNDGGTQLVGLTIAGIPIATTPDPNTVIPLAGLGFVILNEQFCDNGDEADHTCAGSEHSGLTVRALRVVILQGNTLGLPPGVELIIAEAHSDAGFIG